MAAIAFVADDGSGVAFVFDAWGSAVRGLDGTWRSPAPVSRVGDFADGYDTASAADALALSKEARIATLEFPPSVEFFDVEGIPVTLGNVPGVKFSSAAWDEAEPRVFDPVSARRNGAPVSKAQFLALSYVWITARVLTNGELQKEPSSEFFEFLPKTEFFDVEGIPVTIAAGGSVPYCARWDEDPPGKFDPESARRSGAPVSKDKFLALVAEAKLPSNFEMAAMSVKSPSDVKFLDVEGIPVSLGRIPNTGIPFCAAWDKESPRPFPPNSATRNGAVISEERFNELIAKFKSKDKKIMEEKIAKSEFTKLQRAIEIAVSAHKDQVDKAGAPYILHPLRVMMSLTTENERIVGVLHDVIEDTDWTLELLREEGFSEIVLDALESVTIMRGENYEDFVRRAGRNKIGRRVKIADLHDNMDLKRIQKPTERDFERMKKYSKALDYLQLEGQYEPSGTREPSTKNTPQAGSQMPSIEVSPVTNHNRENPWPSTIPLEEFGKMAVRAMVSNLNKQVSKEGPPPLPRNRDNPWPTSITARQLTEGLAQSPNSGAREDGPIPPKKPVEVADFGRNLIGKLWPFKSKVSPRPTELLPLLVFKSRSEFFEYQCKYGQTKIKKGFGIVGIVLDAREYGSPFSVKIEKDGTQFAMIRVASDDGGFLVFAMTPRKGDLLSVGDLIFWVPSIFSDETGSALQDSRSGWVGMIRAKIAPELSVNPGEGMNGFKILCEY